MSKGWKRSACFWDLTRLPTTIPSWAVGGVDFLPYSNEAPSPVVSDKTIQSETVGVHSASSPSLDGAASQGASSDRSLNNTISKTSKFQQKIIHHTKNQETFQQNARWQSADANTVTIQMLQSSDKGVKRASWKHTTEQVQMCSNEWKYRKSQQWTLFQHRNKRYK